MAYVGIFILGLVIGGVLISTISSVRSVGSLRIDESDPDDGSYLFLELKKTSPPEVLKQKKYVTLKVHVENFISHD